MSLGVKITWTRLVPAGGTTVGSGKLHVPGTVSVPSTNTEASVCPEVIDDSVGCTTTSGLMRLTVTGTAMVTMP